VGACETLHADQALRNKSLQIIQTDYGPLDAQVNDWCTSHQRLANGQWPIAVFAEVVVGNWKLFPTQVAPWREQFPDSIVPGLLEALYFDRFAKEAGADKSAYQMTSEDRALTDSRLRQENTSLDAIASKKNSCPLWYSQKLTVMSKLSATEDELDAVFHEAVEAFPAYEPIYRARASRLSREGADGLLAYDGFAHAAQKLSEQTEGAAMYARLWSDAACLCVPRSIRNVVPDTTLLKQGFEDILRISPDDINALNKYFSFGLDMHDSEVVDKTVKHLRALGVPVNGSLS
jgi:hypothetical protein